MNGNKHLSDEERYALEAVEEALAGGAGASNHAELGALSRLLVNTTPQADPAFERELEERLIASRCATFKQIEASVETEPTARATGHPTRAADKSILHLWTVPNWIGRSLRQSLDVAVTLGLLAIFFVVFLWPAVRPARRETTFFYHMPDGLTRTELFGKDDPPLPVEVNGQKLWRSLTLAEVQTVVDYPVLAPTILDDLRFQGASYVHSTGGVVTHYAHPDANQTFTLREQPIGPEIDVTAKLPIGPEARVETIRLNGVKAEYVEGTWDTDLESSYYLYINRFENPLSLDWNSILRLNWTGEARERVLRWERDGILYTLEVFDTSLNDPPHTKHGALYLDREGMVQLAETLQ